MRFRKKPVVIEAVRWTGGNLPEIIEFTGRHYSALRWTWKEYEDVVKKNGLRIFTLEGTMSAAVGDWIIKGYSTQQGYHYWPVKPDYFDENYEEVKNEET
jgi:hypothetical protein